MIPIPYTEECMTGFEYAAAGLMIEEGMVREGVEIVEAVRDRYDGKKRNPYAEIECGSSYARSMASFALPAVFSGFRFDMTKKIIGFSPVIQERPFDCFWAVADAWGTVRIEDNRTVLTVLYGTLTLNAFLLADERKVAAVTEDSEPVGFTQQSAQVHFDAPAAIARSLVIE